jgi:hypothetical protein
LLAYRVDNFFHASYEVLAVAIRGVIVGEVDARMELRISLSCLTQWFFMAINGEVSSNEGHCDSPLT